MGGLNACVLYDGTRIDSRCAFWNGKRIGVEKAVIHARLIYAGETAVSDRGRLKGQAARVTHSGQCVLFH